MTPDELRQRVAELEVKVGLLREAVAKDRTMFITHKQIEDGCFHPDREKDCACRIRAQLRKEILKDFDAVVEGSSEVLAAHDAEVRAGVWTKVELAVYGEYHGPYDSQGYHDCERCETISEVLQKLKKAREAEEKAK